MKVVKTKRKRNGAARTKVLQIVLSEEEYETCLQAAAVADKSGSGWARDILISRALASVWNNR